ncbi:unnamed protein product [Cunninghamella blakesleeana]
MNNNIDFLFTLPFQSRPGTDFMSKLILLDKSVINIIIETIIGEAALNKYSPAPTEWANGSISDHQSLITNPYHNDPTIQQLYTIAKRIFGDEIKIEQNTIDEIKYLCKTTKITIETAISLNHHDITNVEVLANLENTLEKVIYI